MIYTSVWYLALALYNCALLICRIYAFDIKLGLKECQKISSIIAIGSIFMSLTVVYSAIFESYKTRSSLVIVMYAVYAVYSLLRLVLSSLFKENRATGLFFVLSRLRLASFVSSTHALFLQLSFKIGLDGTGKTLLTVVSAAISSFLLIFTSKKHKFFKNN
jgi:hypothetical protein